MKEMGLPSSQIALNTNNLATLRKERSQARASAFAAVMSEGIPIERLRV